MNPRAYPVTVHDGDLINELVRSHIPLARKIAWQIHGRVRDLLDIDDMIQIGMTALIEAAHRFKDTGEATFGSYASIRVRGALVDHIRNNLSLTRTAVTHRDQIAAARRAITAEGGDGTDLAQVALKLNISVAELHGWNDQINRVADKSLDEIYDDHSVWFADTSHSPESALLTVETREQLVEALKKLSERDALVLQLYYVEELNLEEIAETLSVSIGRVSQIKKAAIAELRKWMTEEQSAPPRHVADMRPSNRS
jgi:RNA polymerase sigma factor for flagellar operon FliA